MYQEIINSVSGWIDVVVKFVTTFPTKVIHYVVGIIETLEALFVKGEILDVEPYKLMWTAVSVIVLYVILSALIPKRKIKSDICLKVSDDAGGTYHKVYIKSCDDKALSIITDALDSTDGRWSIFENGKRTKVCPAHQTMIDVIKSDLETGLHEGN